MAVMKMRDALTYYRTLNQDIISRQKEMQKQKENLQKKAAGSDCYQDQIASLTISLEGLKKQEEDTTNQLNQLWEQYDTIWNGEVAKQQGDAYKKMGEELGKIIEVARRIANGDIVPATDEKKLLEYNDEMYQAAKNMAALKEMNEARERKRQDSLWEEEEPQKEYDPEGAAEQSEVSVPAEATVDTQGELFV